MPEDDKDSQMLKTLPQATGRDSKYEPLKERGVAQQATTPVTPFHDEQDIGYHSGFEHAEQSWGPLDEKNRA